MVLLAIHGRFWSFRFHCLLSALLCGSYMCTQVSSFVSKLEITNTAFICFQNSRAHLRHCVFCSSVSKWGIHLAQTFSGPNAFQNCLHTAFWYASTTSYNFDRQSHILFNHNLHSSGVSLGDRGFRPCRTVSSSTENFPALKALTHLKTVHIEMVWGPYILHNSLNICFESILSLMRHLIYRYEFQSSVPCSNVTSKLVSVYDCIYFNLK